MVQAQVAALWAPPMDCRTDEAPTKKCTLTLRRAACTTPSARANRARQVWAAAASGDCPAHATRAVVSIHPTRAAAIPSCCRAVQAAEMFLFVSFQTNATHNLQALQVLYITRQILEVVIAKVERAQCLCRRDYDDCRYQKGCTDEEKIARQTLFGDVVVRQIEHLQRRK